MYTQHCMLCICTLCMSHRSADSGPCILQHMLGKLHPGKLQCALWVLHTVNYAHCTDLHSAYCTHVTVDTVDCLPCTLHFALCTLHILYTAHCALYTQHRALSTL